MPSSIQGTPVPRLLLAAPSSGSGKTTVVCALLQALKDRGLSPAAFKSGPDYIDPMFHRRSWIRRRIIWTSFSSAATSRAPQLPGRRCCAMVLRLM